MDVQQKRDTGASRDAVSGSLRGRDLLSTDRLPLADIVIVGTTVKQARRLPALASLVMPMRVHLVIDIDGDESVVGKRISRRESWQFRRNLRSRDWNLSIEHDPMWFDTFYDSMYRPTMTKRHGIYERVEAKEVAYECLFRSGYLFMLSDSGQRIGGALCQWYPNSRRLTMRLVGVADGVDEHYRSGAFKAVYHLLIGWAAQNGVRQIDLHGTESFLSKGTFQWKRRMGARVILPPNHFRNKRLWVQVRRDTPAVRDFLVANPMLVETADGSLQPVYFHDEHRPPRLDYSAKSPGMKELCCLDIDEFIETAAA